jgi:ribosome recycling factor
MQTIINEKKGEFDGVIEWFSQELKNIRTGRATPALVEDLKVSYFGTSTPLKQVASISVTDAKTIVISPWSKDTLIDIEKAINESDLNLVPNNDGNVIRIILPSLTEERRKDLVKLLNKKTEEARIKIRQIREDIWDEVQQKVQAGDLPEDDKFRAKDKLQEIVDEFNKKIEELSRKKEDEVMQI